MKKRTKRYCTGCNLCKVLGEGSLEIDNKGFFHPKELNEKFENGVCPSCGVQSKRLSRESIWGKKEEVYLGWSSDPMIRKSASSGGTITSIACYLLINNIVDGIIQICESNKIPYKTKTVINYSIEDVLHCKGSRYSISHPLDIFEELDKNKKYCLIGKPCDITVFKNYLSLDPDINNVITLSLSFFCMGLPSDKAQLKLLNKLDTNLEKIKEINYRGNGWPGYATALNLDNSKKSITYDESWGKILGRDLMPYCRYCIDGIGEDADISCGDAWYEKDGKPDFNEHDGRNVIFARTKKGKDLLEQMGQAKKIYIEKIDNYEEYLRIIQHSQFMRRATLKSRILALKLMMRPYPHYSNDVLNSYSRQVNFKENTRVFLGMLKRIFKGKY